MPHTTSLIVRPALVVLAFGALGCSSDLVLPESAGGSAQTVALTKAGGDVQTGPVGETLGKPLVVRVLDGEQHPVSGLSVSFDLSDPAAGVVSPASATTNAAGEAVANWTLGTVPGTYTVVARLVGVLGADKVTEFQGSATPGAPAALTAQTPLLQPGSREQKVQTAPVVQVVDRYGNPVPDVPVAWQVISGEGTASPLNGTTDPDGNAAADWTLGNRIGVHKLSASVDGVASSVIFEARVLF
jgi:Bacterial Ig-like domain (group 1)